MVSSRFGVAALSLSVASGRGDGDPNDLHELVAKLKEEVEQLRKRNAELESHQPQKATTGKPVSDAGLEVAPISDADATLRRLVQRIAMILQAEQVVIMFYDRERGELIGIPPAFGVEEERLTHFRVRATHGISGMVFREAEPIVFHDAATDPRADGDPFTFLHVQNGITVPLVIEKRDEENRIIDRNTIGVLHAFNKRHGEDFNDEDVRLLERMSKNVGSIIANLQLYREVVEEREELLQTFESLSAGLMLVSPELRINQMNGTARHIFSVGPEAIGKLVAEVVNDDKLQTMFQTALRGDEVPGIEIERHIAGNDRIYQVQAASVRNEEGKDIGVVAILSDITEVKNIERMKSSFVAMASHELRTPLTAIKGFSSTLLEGIDDDMYTKEDQKEFLGIVVSECDRLRRLIDDLLNTSRIEAGESLKPNYSEINVLDLIEKVAKVQQQATNKHEIKLDIKGELPEKMVADQDKFDQILTNLMNNAIKYAPDGGDITIHASCDGEFLQVGIEDQGLGIPKDHLTKVFERFHRVNNEDNRKIYGTGLGLFLVKHLVEEVHFGKIWVESELGVGSTFWFKVPIEIDIEKAKEINQ